MGSSTHWNREESARQRILDVYRIVDSLPDDACDDIVRIASTVCDTPIALISLIDRDRQWFKAQFGQAETQTSRDLAVCDHAIRTPDALLEIPDLAEDPRFADYPIVTGRAGARFYAGMPLVTPEGAPIGTVCVVDVVPRQLDERQRRTLHALAHLTVSLFESHRREHQRECHRLLAQAAGLHAAPAGFSVVVLQLQELATLAGRIGERTLERTLEQLHRRLQRCIDPESGDTLAHVSGSGDFVAVLHGTDTEGRKRALQDAARQQSELGPAMLIGAARAERDEDDFDRVFLRADAALSGAKDAYRKLPSQALENRPGAAAHDPVQRLS